ncbi:MAG TPA: hypothetical protein VGU45_11830 [Microvirga sp.]|jgi:hypothetical protein|nr:hypothetical protein [Microvirga sp.]
MTSTSTFDPKAFLDRIAADPAFAAQLRAILGEAAPAVASTPSSDLPQARLPALDAITLLQATLFDNGPDGTRAKYQARYKVTLEVWTEAADAIRLSEWQWKRSVVLSDRDPFLVRVDTLKNRGAITPEYHAALLKLWSTAGPGFWFGLMGDKGQKGGRGGTTYYDGQCLVLAMDAGTPGEGYVVHAPREDSIDMVPLAPWSLRNSAGNLLTGKARYQSRLDRCHYNAAWPTTS